MNEARQSFHRNVEHEALGHTLSLRRLARLAGVSETTARRWDADAYAVSSQSAGKLSKAWYGEIMERLPEARRREIQRSSPVGS